MDKELGQAIKEYDKAIKSFKMALSLYERWEDVYKAGAKAMYALLTDDAYTHIEMKAEKYPEYLTKLRKLLTP